MSTNEEEVQQALEVLHRHLKYVVQKQRDGVWVNATPDPITGKEAAYQVMRRLKAERETFGDRRPWRVIPRNEADMYRAGLRAGMERTSVRGEGNEKRRPMMYLPEHL